MSPEVLGARSRRPPKQPKEGCAECGSEGALWQAGDGFWYCQKCIDLNNIPISDDAQMKKVVSAFVCQTTPATVYEYRYRRPDRRLVSLYDAIYFAYIAFSDETAGLRRFGDKTFESGATYEYRVEVVDTRDGLESEWLMENVLMRLTPTDQNWVKRSHAEQLTRSGFTQKGKPFTFHKKHQVIPVRWTPPGLRSRVWDPVPVEKEDS